jgi:hypothetical protein
LARPSGPDIERALNRLRDFASEASCAVEGEEVEATLRAAIAPRPVMLSKEAAEALGVDPANLEPRSVADLPEPAQVVPRPTVRHPDRVVRLWWADEIEACAAAKRARATGANGED